MLRKTAVLCCVVIIGLAAITACNGDEPEIDPTPQPTSGPPETHTIDCNIQTLIDLLEDIPSNGLVINIPVCIFTFDSINNTPEDPEVGDFGGAALPVIDGFVTINGVSGTTFTRSTDDGIEPFRFFYIAPSGSLTLNSITFTNGNASMGITDLGSKGGAVFNNGGALTIDNCTFENNQANQGGAIASESGGNNFRNSYFSQNHSYWEGGAVAILGHGFEYSEISACEFTDNLGESSGGALFSEGRLRLGYASIFENNQSLGGGGALAINGGVVFATEVIFDHNTAEMGGAIIVYDTDQQIEFIECEITNNQVTAPQDSRGGGVYLHNVGDSEFGSCQLNFNSAENGGAVYALNSTVEINNGSRVIGNNANILGGGVYLDHDSTGIIKTTYLTDNIAGHFGGAIHNKGDLSIYNVNIISNNALEFMGGGISNNNGSVSIINSAVAGNLALLGGGGMESDNFASIFNSTFSGNQAENGSAISFEGQLEIIHSTIAFNIANSNSGIFSSRGNATIKNSIIAENTIGGNSTYNCQAAINAIGDNLDDDDSCDGFNLTGNPRLEPLDDNGGYTKNHAITFFSPAFNAALDCSDLSGTDVDADQRGVVRPQDEECDIGAFELEWATGQPLSPNPYVIFNRNAYCRQSPDSNSASLTSFEAGDAAEVIGRNINLTWYQLAPTQIEIPCWVWVDLAELIGDLDSVEIIPFGTVDEVMNESAETPTCPPPSGGCPIKESPQCWDEILCKCGPCS